MGEDRNRPDGGGLSDTWDRAASRWKRGEGCPTLSNVLQNRECHSHPPHAATPDEQYSGIGAERTPWYADSMNADDTAGFAMMMRGSRLPVWIAGG